MSKENIRYGLLCEKAYRMSREIIVDKDGERQVVPSAIRDLVYEEEDGLSNEEKVVLHQLISDELSYAGPLGPIMRDGFVQGIRVYYTGRVEVDDATGGWIESAFCFQSRAHVEELAEKLTTDGATGSGSSVNGASASEAQILLKQCGKDFSIEFSRESEPMLLFKRRVGEH
ncbi:hypothetical protein GC174_03780 [bacterium]|nr:hypothetical protein [bacterium]